MTVLARIGNLGEGGLFLRTRTPVRPGVMARLRIHGESFLAEGQVAWISEGGPTDACGMGVSFRSLDPGARLALARLLESERLRA